MCDRGIFGEVAAAGVTRLSSDIAFSVAPGVPIASFSFGKSESLYSSRIASPITHVHDFDARVFCAKEKEGRGVGSLKRKRRRAPTAVPQAAHEPHVLPEAKEC